MTTTTTAQSSDVEHARALAKLSARGVHRHWIEQRSTSLPDALAALRGLFVLAEAGRLDARSARRIVVGSWARLAPRPTLVVPVEAWRELFAIGGPSIDEDTWRRPESLVLFRGCADVPAARSGMSWTLEPAVARCHAEGMTGSSASAHSSPRIFTTTAPREALLARIDSNGESEIVVDPALLDEVSEVPREEWKSWPAPVRVWISADEWTVVPDVAHWRRFARTR
ncbi:hypothetical protein ACI782_02830 [Geodermatophilus sp. SYSU D00703]